MSNISIFRNHLKEIDVFMEEVQEDDGGIFFRISQNMENGGSVVLVISFDKDERIVDFNVLNIAKITNVLKREEIHQFLNTLNVRYRYAKFVERDGTISIDYALLVEEGKLNPQILLDRLISLLRVAEDEYPNFMKIQWS